MLLSLNSSAAAPAADATLAPADVSVIVCAYTEERWDDLTAAVGSLRAQFGPPLEIIVVADHNDALLARVRAELPNVVAVSNEQERGLSGARNSGVEVARGALIAFLDDDAVAEPDWLTELVDVFGDSAVIGAGGPAEPAWDGGRPRAFPREFDWVVGCTYEGMPEHRSPIRNPVGANMLFRREVFEAVGGFRHGIGRVGKRPVGCEETEFCIRAQAHFTGATIVYEPRARVRHRVPASRAHWTYFRSRCYAEGLSKALVTSFAGRGPGLASERTYTLRTLPTGVGRGLLDALRGDVSGLGRAAAIVVGLAVTTVGYVVGTAVTRFSKGTAAKEAGR